jgi:N6-adenosine-specific RNA methylase IME4
MADSALLYRNEEGDVILIDIPTSIATAQGRSDILLSTTPLEEPISLLEEPNSTKAKTKVKAGEGAGADHLQYNPSEDRHAEYKHIITRALAEIRHHVSGHWCMPRKLMIQLPKSGKGDMQIDNAEKELEARLREWVALAESKGDDTAFDLQKMMASLGAGDLDANAKREAQQWSMSYRPAHELKGDLQRDNFSDPEEVETSQEPWMSSFHNPEKHALDLTIFDDQLGQEAPWYSFTIPPRATFFLSDSMHPDIFRASFRKLTDEFTLPRHFDLVLLDPPWPNRSAKRKGTYEQVGGMPHMRKMLLRMNIDNYIEHNAVVGIWITNKEAVREHVLGPGGLFEIWNVGLFEEWIWVKTTVHGEPMFDMHSVSRKPYEILLLGRAAPNSWTTMRAAPVIKQKVIAAVPDVHSRKPCLKPLLEPYMPTTYEYSALEIFSRHLVSGWTSWGNEVLKYNSSQYWTLRSERPESGSPLR